MTWILSDNGTATTITIGSETTLATDTNNGTFVLEVDTSNMVAGDQLEIRAYTITLSGSGTQQAWKGSYANGQINIHKISPPIASDQSLKTTLNQRGGTISLTSNTNFGTIFEGSYGVGVTSSAAAIIRFAGGGNVSSGTGSTSAFVIMTSSGTANSFSNGEHVNCSTSPGSTTTSTAHQFTIAAAPTGRSYTWKMLRI